MSNEKNPGWLGFFLGIILPSCIGIIRIIINHYKDPFEPTSIMESRRFFFVAQVTPRSPVASLLRRPEKNVKKILVDSKKNPRDPWNLPQVPQSTTIEGVPS